MKSAIGRGMVATLLLTAGCGSNDNGMPGSGGRADAGSGGAGMGGISGSGGMGGVGVGGAGGGVGGTGGGAGTGEGGIGGKGSGGSVGIDAAADGAGVRDGGTGGSDGESDWLGLSPVPPALEVPAGATLKIHDRGIGVQIYTCTASGAVDAGTDGGSATYAWVLKAPDAKLFDAANVQVGTHGIGPAWTATVDGSKVNGAKVAQVDSPVASAIPWLLLRASANSGTGAFADITYVQRVNTIGGRAPISGCDATAVNTDVSIDYSADYYFYTGGAGAAWLALPANVPSLLLVPAGRGQRFVSGLVTSWRSYSDD